MNRWYQVADGHYQCAAWDVLYDPARDVWTVTHAQADRPLDRAFPTSDAAIRFCERPD